MSEETKPRVYGADDGPDTPPPPAGLRGERSPTETPMSTRTIGDLTIEEQSGVAAAETTGLNPADGEDR